MATGVSQTFTPCIFRWRPMFRQFITVIVQEKKVRQGSLVIQLCTFDSVRLQLLSGFGDCQTCVNGVGAESRLLASKMSSNC